MIVDATSNDLAVVLLHKTCFKNILSEVNHSAFPAASILKEILGSLNTAYSVFQLLKSNFSKMVKDNKFLLAFLYQF